MMHSQPQLPPRPRGPLKPQLGIQHRRQSNILWHGDISQDAAAMPPPLRPAEDIPCPRAAQNGFTFGDGRETLPGAQRQPIPLSISRQDPPQIPKEIQRVVQARLLSAEQSSKDEQHALVKKLLVTWHPDRN